MQRDVRVSTYRGVDQAQHEPIDVSGGYTRTFQIPITMCSTTTEGGVAVVLAGPLGLGGGIDVKHPMNLKKERREQM